MVNLKGRKKIDKEEFYSIINLKLEELKNKHCPNGTITTIGKGKTVHSRGKRQ
jgi:hypothetical protein